MLESLIEGGTSSLFQGRIVYYVIGVIGVIAAHLYRRQKETLERRMKWNSAPRNKVILHGFVRARTLPTISPFMLKLETYFRMAGIDYELDTVQPRGAKGKTPWITMNGKDKCDSQMIIEYLGKKFETDFSSDISVEQRAAGRAIQIMLEEHFYWGMMLWSMVYNKPSSILDVYKMEDSMAIFYVFFGFVIQRKVRNEAWAQGIGRHSKEEVIQLMLSDLRTVADFLGKKPFLLGPHPTEYDCAVFGVLAQCVWALPGSPFREAVEGDLKVLKDYCYRMKERFWKDWDHCLNPKPEEVSNAINNASAAT